MSELKRSTTRAIAWSAVDKAAQQALLLVVSLTAMRWWLDAEDFGLLAPLALFTGVANSLVEGGFSLALIRKADATERDYNTMFWFNVGLAAIFYAILFAAAPAIARVNDMPGLTLAARWQFLSIVFSAPGMIHSVQLLKRNDFRRVSRANIASVFLASATVVALSASGYGYWALVGRELVLTLSRTLILWLSNGWRPRGVFDWTSVRQTLGFSSKLIAGDLATMFSNGFYNTALRSYGVSQAQLGFYDRAYKIKDNVPMVLNHMFGNSMVVMLSRLQGEPGRLLAAFRKALRTLSFLLFPALLGLFVTAGPLIEVVLTDKWSAAVPYIRLLCFSSLLALLGTQHAQALKIRGRSDLTLIFSVVNAALLVIFLPLTIRYGLRAALGADIAVRAIVYICYGTASARVLGYRWADQLRDLTPYAGLAVAMAAAVWPLRYVIDHSPLLLLAQAGAGAAIYLGATYGLGSKVFEEVRQMIRKKSDSTT